jgi:hypothetical protein
MLALPGAKIESEGIAMRAPAGENSHPQLHGSSAPDALVRAMTAALASQRPQSAAEALQMLRRGYPHIPLAMRVAAICAGAK